MIRTSTMRFDLHMHSDRSDGLLPVDDLLAKCVAGRLDVVAITDHDLDPQVPHGPTQIDGKPIHLIHATEASVLHQGKELHMLVYFPGAMPQSFRQLMQAQARKRATRYDTALERIGLPDVTKASPEAHRGEHSLTRLHLARALRDSGHVKHVNEAFGKWLGGPESVVPTVDLTVQECFAQAHQAGGFVSWAHPSIEQAAKYLRDLVTAGLDGLEVFRPNLGRFKRQKLWSLAHKHRLVPTGGSDFHGMPGQRLGGFGFSGRAAMPFAKRMQLRL